MSSSDNAPTNSDRTPTTGSAGPNNPLTLPTTTTSQTPVDQSTTTPQRDDTNNDADDADDPLVLLRGQLVKVHGLVESYDLNGRLATVLDDFVSADTDDYVFVRINKPFFTYEKRMVRRCNVTAVHSDDVERKVQVIWTYNRRLNTGQRGGFAEVMADAYAADNEDESSVRCIACTQSELHGFIEQMHFEKQLDMTLLRRLGLCLHAFAFDVDAAVANEEGNGENELRVGKGKDNVIATHMCEGTTNVVGTAFFVRVDNNTGRLVDFSFDECMRTFMFLNDMEAVKDEFPNKILSDTTWETLTRCFPFYDIGCRLTANGFFGLRSMIRNPEGSFTLEPPNMKPVDSFTLDDQQGDGDDGDDDDDDDAVNDAQLLAN